MIGLQPLKHRYNTPRMAFYIVPKMVTSLFKYTFFVNYHIPFLEGIARMHFLDGNIIQTVSFLVTNSYLHSSIRKYIEACFRKSFFEDFPSFVVSDDNFYSFKRWYFHIVQSYIYIKTFKRKLKFCSNLYTFLAYLASYLCRRFQFKVKKVWQRQVFST